MLDLQRPRGLPELFGAAAQLYARHLALWLLLAGLLVVPFEIIVLAVTGSAHGSQLTAHEERQLLLFVVVEFVLVIPLISALQVHAVALLGEGEQPRLGAIFRRAGRRLPTVVAASIITAIGVVAGLVLFILPGVWLLLRLYVVAQTAAIEGTNWPATLRRSYTLTRGNSWRILGLLVIVGLINFTLDSVAGSLVGSGGSAVHDIIAVVVSLLLQSFSGLLTAVLYFDLRARKASPVNPAYY